MVRLPNCLRFLTYYKNFFSGSCYFKTAAEYFTVIENLFNQLKIPDIRVMKQPTWTSIKNAFLTLNSPRLFSSAINVIMDKQGRLDEIRICYDLQYQFLSCRQ
jgi:ribonuclease I